MATSSETDDDEKHTTEEPHLRDVHGMGLDATDYGDYSTQSEEEENESDTDAEDLTPIGDPDSSGDEVSSPPAVIGTEYRLIYTRGYRPHSSFSERIIPLITTLIPGVGSQKVFRLNALDCSLLPETQQLETFEQEVYTFFGIELKTMRRTGDVTLLQEVYDSVRVGLIYTDLFQILRQETSLTTRSAITADGKPTNGFYPKMVQVASAHRDYHRMITNPDTFYNTLDHVYNQFVLAGLRQQMSQPQTSGLCFRPNGPCGVTQPHGRRTGLLPWIVTLKNPSFTMGALTCFTVMSISWMAYYRSQKCEPYYQWDPALMMPTLTGHTERYSARLSRTLGRYMATMITTWPSLFAGLQPRAKATSFIISC